MELKQSEIEFLAHEVQEIIQDHVRTINQEPIVGPELNRAKLRELLREPLPRHPQGVEAGLADFRKKILPQCVKVGHPRWLAWIRTSPLVVAAYADALAAILNQSVTAWEGAPAAAETELVVIDWIKDASCYARSAGGILTSGGSAANSVCLHAALAAADPEFREHGLAGKAPFAVYMTSETHYALRKAVTLMGIGARNIRYVAMDCELRMSPSALEAAIILDRDAGIRPLAAVFTLGSVNTGACDQFRPLVEVAQRHGVWSHIDGAYGGFTGLVPEKRSLIDGIDQADSLALDPHKMFIPFEAGCALVREPQHLFNAFSVHADYLPNSVQGDDAPFHFRDYGPQLARSFRALKIYLCFKVYGVDAIADALAKNYHLSAELGELVEADGDFELLAKPTLGITAFRYAPGRRDRGPADDAALDDLNTQLAIEVQHRGRVFLASTRVHNRVALRTCFVSFRTEVKDLKILMEEVRTVAKALSAH
jgi:aromatic-L-amino-acid/L-tryptophan decarboxylase